MLLASEPESFEKRSAERRSSTQEQIQSWTTSGKRSESAAEGYGTRAYKGDTQGGYDTVVRENGMITSEAHRRGA